MKAYLVLGLTVNDFAGYRQYIAEIPALIAKHARRRPHADRGRLEARTHGDHRVSGRRNGDAFLGDPETRDLFKNRHATTTSRLVLAEGCT